MKITIILVLSIVMSCFGLVACDSGANPASSVTNDSGVPAPYAGRTNPRANNSAAIEEGNEIYNVNCSSCHGEYGKGDGPAAAALDPHPKDLSATVKSLGDDYLLWRISDGGAMTPFKSAMPSWKATLSEDQIWAVIAYLRFLTK